MFLKLSLKFRVAMAFFQTGKTQDLPKILEKTGRNLHPSRPSNSVWLLICQANVITTRIRRMGEGTVFSLFVSPHLDGGYPIPDLDQGVPHPRSRQGGYPVQLIGGYPHPARLTGGYPIQGLDRGTPSQVWMKGVCPLARTGWGTPPGQHWMGVPPRASTGWDTPQARTCIT